MKRIIYMNETGGTSVIIPIEDCGLSVEEIAAKDVPAGCTYKIIDASELPADRTFRNAWEISGAAVSVNLQKAKDIAHDKRRTARSVELAPLDIEATIPAKAAQAEAKRQTIRDKYDAIQAEIDAASIDELKLIIQQLP